MPGSCNRAIWMNMSRESQMRFGHRRFAGPDSESRRHPVTEDRPTFNLVRWFTVLSFLSIGAASAGSAFVLSSFLTEHFLYREAEVMTEFINGVIDVERADKVKGPYADWIEGDVEEFFYHIGGTPDVVRANVYRPDGSIIWSTDPAMVGRKFERNEELESAFGGQPVIHMTARGKARRTSTLTSSWSPASGSLKAICRSGATRPVPGEPMASSRSIARRDDCSKPLSPA